MSEGTPLIVPVFFATWFALMIGSMIFRYTAPIELRRRLRVPIAILVPLVFATFIGLMGGLPAVAFIALPLALITAMIVRGSRICPKCGSENQNPNIFAFTPPTYCQKCGAKHDD